MHLFTIFLCKQYSEHLKIACLRSNKTEACYTSSGKLVDFFPLPLFALFLASIYFLAIILVCLKICVDKIKTFFVVNVYSHSILTRTVETQLEGKGF